MVAVRAQVWVTLVVVVVLAAAVAQWFRPVPAPTVALARTTMAVPGPRPHLPIPAGVPTYVDVPAVGALAGQDATTPRPIGSVAKMMTALLVLKAHPLGLYAQGPTLTVTAAEAATEVADAANQQSVMPVTAGEKLSERKALEGLLIASANNIADMLGVWIAGSDAKFVAQMNAEAKTLGLTGTHYADASGLAPQTVSTPQDQVRLAEDAMRIPLFAAIVAMPQMTLPNGGGLSYNYNYALGKNGIVGVKTGSTTQGGASFVWAAANGGTGTATVYGALLGQMATTPTASQLGVILSEGQSLARSALAAVGSHTVLARGASAGTLDVAWSPPVRLVTTAPVTIEGWGGLAVHMRLVAKAPAAAKGIAAGTRVGVLVVTAGSQKVTVPLVTASAVPAPSPSWRLRRL